MNKININNYQIKNKYVKNDMELLDLTKYKNFINSNDTYYEDINVSVISDDIDLRKLAEAYENNDISMCDEIIGKSKTVVDTYLTNGNDAIYDYLNTIVSYSWSSKNDSEIIGTLYIMTGEQYKEMISLLHRSYNNFHCTINKVNDNDKILITTYREKDLI